MKKLRPFILTCDMRLDAFRKFIESYKTVTHTMLPPIVLAGFYDPDKREEYGALIEELNPYKVIEQTNYYKETKDIPIGCNNERGNGDDNWIPPSDPRAYLNIQKTVIKDFPDIALKYSEENIIWIEDDTVFSSQFPEAIEKVNQHIQSDCDIITLYSPSLREGSPWDLERGMTDDGYTTKKALPSDDFIHAIHGSSFFGTPCVVFNRKTLMKFKNNWEEMETLSTAWDERWGIYAENSGLRMYATRKSYVQHQHGYSIIEEGSVNLSTKTFVE